MTTTVTEVRAYGLPYDYWHDRYQAYYATGIQRELEAGGSTYVEISLSRAAFLLRRMRRVRHASRLAPAMQLGGAALLDGTAALIGGAGQAPAGSTNPLVGQYLFTLSDGETRNVCIDAQDSGEVGSPELLAWSDVYFKTNYWPTRGYDDRVRPLYNGNPLLLGKLGRLRALRQVVKTYDLCFIVRVWGGRDEVEGVEHNLRLIEAAARVSGRNYLLAYLVAGEIDTHARRLEKQGIPWRTTPMPLDELWGISAASRVNVIRLGMHACVPWRMADTLAMGACPVLDQPPLTIWPVPLNESRNYINLGAATTDSQTASFTRYDEIPSKLTSILADPSLAHRIAANNALYFDEHLAPEAVGRYVCAVVARSQKCRAEALK